MFPLSEANHFSHSDFVVGQRLTLSQLVLIMGFVYTELFDQVETCVFLPAWQEHQIGEAECFLLVVAGEVPTGDYSGKHRNNRF